MSSVVPSIYYSLIVAGIIAVYFISGSSLNGTIAGYAFIIAGLIIMVGYLVNNMRIKQAEGKNNTSAMFYTVGPLISIICLIVYILYLLGIYFDRITGGNVSPGYYTFSSIFALILILQLVIFYYASRTKQYLDSFTISSSTSCAMILFTILNCVVVYTMYIILKYYSTDG